MSHDFISKEVSEKAILRLIKLAAQHAGRMDNLVRVFLAAKEYMLETTHEIRILTRKCGVAWRILCQAGADIDHHKSRKGLRFLRRCLGPLRDADIRLEEFERFARNRKTGRNDTLSGVLQQSWLQCYREAVAQVRQEWPKHRKTLKSIIKQSQHLTHVLGKLRWDKHDEHWLRKQWIKWKRSAGRTMDRKHLHVFRIKTKRLRYLSQFLLPHKAPAHLSAWLKQLDELQQVLGRHRDLNNVVDWLSQLLEEISIKVDKLGNLSSSIQSLRKYCDQHIRRQDGRLNKLRMKLFSK